MWLPKDCGSSRVYKEMQRAPKKLCRDRGWGGDRDVASHIGGVMDAGGWREYPREDWSLRTERQHSFASYVL